MTGWGSPDAPHVPVLLEEVLTAMAVQSGETVIDGTYGAGGYSAALLRVGAGRVIAFDRDPMRSKQHGHSSQTRDLSSSKSASARWIAC